MNRLAHIEQQRLLESFFLPDLCNARAILILLVVTEGLVLALTLVESGLTSFSIPRFALVSFFVQWVALLSVAILCQSRTLLVRLPTWGASVLAMAIIQLVTLLVSILGDFIWPQYIQTIDWSWIMRNMLVSGIFAAMGLRYFYVQSQWRLKTQAELKSRLAALQANIRPHFFFNTLNTVASLIVIDPEKAERMLLDLAQLFRAVLKGGDTPTSLAEEIALGQGYLDIEQTRLGERLTVVWELPHSLPDVKVPKLMLQPILENAVYHGIQPSIDNGEICTSLTHVSRSEASTGEPGWYIKVSNTKQAGPTTTQGNRIAQQNIKARLDAQFGGRARLEIEDLGQRYNVSIFIPDDSHEEAT